MIAPEELGTLVFAAAGFAAIASATLFFSSRRRLFLQVFASPDRAEMRRALREIPAEPDFERSLRLVAVLQFAVAACFLIAAIVGWVLG